jgi:WD40 repeat protein
MSSLAAKTEDRTPVPRRCGLLRSCMLVAACGLPLLSLLPACDGDDGRDPAGDGQPGGDGGDASSCLKTVAELDGPATYDYTVDWSPVDDYVLAGTNQDIRLIRADTEAEELELVDSLLKKPKANVVRWSADGRFALSAGLELELLAVPRDPPELVYLDSYTGHEADIYGLDWHPDGAYALTGGRDGTIRLLAVDVDAGTLTEQAIFYGHVGKVLGVNWAPDGRHAISVGEDGTVRLLEVDFEAEPIEIRQVTLQIDGDLENSVSWAAGGNPILTGTWAERHLVQVWSVDVDAGTLSLTNEFLTNPSGVTVLEWSRDGERLATAGHDDTVALSRYRDGELTGIATLEGHLTGVHAVSWSVDESHLIVASSSVDRVSLVNVEDCPRAESE